MSVFVILLLGALFISIELLAFTAVAYKRAAKNKPYSFRYGMYFDTERRQLVGTKTEILTDPKTGIQFLGKTVKQ